MHSVKTLLATAPLLLSFFSSVSASPTGTLTTRSSKPVNSTTCNGKSYVYEEFAGYGYIPSNARDKYGDTIGGIGSSIAIDKNSWKKTGSSYTGIVYALPDRGWNTNGTINFQNRIQKISLTFTPKPDASVANPSKPNIALKYLDTILLTDPSGVPTTGLDAGFAPPYKTFPGIPFGLPSVNYTGDGFGGKGPGGYRVCVDSEGIFLGHDGSFWISDEYGPYVYHFDPKGKMIGAIRPPDALLPVRQGKVSFSADSPPIYAPNLEPSPHNNKIGRNNNQGFEGLTTNPEGTKLYTLLQSSTNQDGGLNDGDNRNSRFLIYDITTAQPTYEAEYVVSLPKLDSKDIAAQSEIHYISDTQFFVLARDSGAGRGQDETESVYRDVDVFDISKATDVKGTHADVFGGQVASTDGVLFSNITAAQYCPFLDFNVNSQLNRFLSAGVPLHNGGKQDVGLLNEKWESIALLPVDPGKAWEENEEFILFSFSDNDFITQDGYMNFGKFKYADASGYNLFNQALAFNVRIPKGSVPLIS